MKYIFALVLEFILQSPNSQITLLITNLFSFISGFLVFKSAAINLVEANKSNRERKRVRKKIIDNKVPIRKYTNFVSTRKKTMKLICIEYDLNRIFSFIVFCLTFLSFFVPNIIIVAWIFFTAKVLLCDLVGHFIMIIFGRMRKAGGTYWDFE